MPFEAFPFELKLFVASSDICFFFFLAAIGSLIMTIVWSSSKETKRALDELFSPDEPVFMEPGGPLVSVLPPLCEDARRGDLLGLVGVYSLRLPSLVRSAQTLFARSSVFLGSLAAFLSPRWTALMTLRSSESGDLLWRVSSSDEYPLGFFAAAARPLPETLPRTQ